MDFVDQFPRPTPPPGHPYLEMANNKNTRCGMASGSPAIVTVFVVVCCGWSRGTGALLWPAKRPAKWPASMVLFLLFFLHEILLSAKMILCKYLPDGGIQWLLPNPWTAPTSGDVCIIAPAH